VPFIPPFKTAILGQTNGKTSGSAVHSAVHTQNATQKKHGSVKTAAQNHAFQVVN
jgi:hypothetical protein